MEQTASGNAVRTTAARRTFDLIATVETLSAANPLRKPCGNFTLQSAANLAKAGWAAVPNSMGHADEPRIATLPARRTARLSRLVNLLFTGEKSANGHEFRRNGGDTDSHGLNPWRARSYEWHLLDTNLLIALLWPSHERHELAMKWLTRHRAKGWATCPLTQTGFVRIVSNPAFSRDAVQPREAIHVLSSNTVAKDHAFWPDELPVAGAVVFTGVRLMGHQ